MLFSESKSTMESNPDERPLPLAFIRECGNHDRGNATYDLPAVVLQGCPSFGSYGCRLFNIRYPKTSYSKNPRTAPILPFQPSLTSSSSWPGACWWIRWNEWEFWHRRKEFGYLSYSVINLIFNWKKKSSKLNFSDVRHSDFVDLSRFIRELPKPRIRLHNHLLYEPMHGWLY